MRLSPPRGGACVFSVFFGVNALSLFSRASWRVDVKEGAHLQNVFYQMVKKILWNFNFKVVFSGPDRDGVGSIFWVHSQSLAVDGWMKVMEIKEKKKGGLLLLIICLLSKLKENKFFSVTKITFFINYYYITYH